jgi:hypothetical protein
LNGAYAIEKEPLNEYLKIHSMPARKTLLFVFELFESKNDAFILFLKDLQNSSLLDFKDINYHDSNSKSFIQNCLDDYVFNESNSNNNKINTFLENLVLKYNF